MQRSTRWTSGDPPQWLRAAVVLAGGIGLLTALIVGGCVTAPGRAAPPKAGDCTTIEVWSNGYHTSLALPGRAFDPDHPVRAIFPDAAYFLIGYGARDFYIHPNPGVITGLAAAAPPTASVVHVIAHSAPVQHTVWIPRTLTPVAVSEAGLARIADHIAGSLVLDPAGRPVIVAQGRVPGRSVFVQARQGFHLFHMCNHWTARGLSDAGVRMCPRRAFTAGNVTDAVARNADQNCPPLQEPY